MPRALWIALFFVIVAGTAAAEADCFAAADSQMALDACAEREAARAQEALSARYDELARRHPEPGTRERIESARRAFLAFWRAHREMVRALSRDPVASMCAELAVADAGQAQLTLIGDRGETDVCRW